MRHDEDQVFGIFMIGSLGLAILATLVCAALRLFGVAQDDTIVIYPAIIWGAVLALVTSLGAIFLAAACVWDFFRGGA